MKVRQLFSPKFSDQVLSLPDFKEWKICARLPVSDTVYHPQGLIRIADLFYLTTVDKKTDRGFLFVLKIENEKLSVLARLDITQGPRFRRYHPGGVDFLPSTNELVIPVAEYSRMKPTTVIAVRLPDLRVRVMGELPDHIGAVICEQERGLIRLTNWDTEGIYTAQIDENHNLKGDWRDFLYEPHQGYFHNPIWGQHGRFAYQDCKNLGNGYAICTGVRRGIAWQHGVIDIVRFGKVRTESFELIKRFSPGPVKSPFQRAFFAVPLTRNPMMLEPVEGENKIRFYFMPHDGPGSCLFVYEASTQ